MVTSFYKDQVQLLVGLLADLGEIGCYTVDGSQGKEAPIHIIDCVVLGHAARETMGFLSDDPRRWNVGLSRAQSGRILICSEDFVTHAKSVGVWTSTIAEAKAKLAILDDAMFHTPIPDKKEREVLGDVVGKFKASAGKGRKVDAPRPPRTKEQVERVRTSQATTMVETLGCTEDEAERYLADCDDDINLAVHRWCLDNEFEEDADVEEIEREPFTNEPPSSFFSPPTPSSMPSSSLVASALAPAASFSVRTLPTRSLPPHQRASAAISPAPIALPVPVSSSPPAAVPGPSVSSLPPHLRQRPLAIDRPPISKAPVADPGPVAQARVEVRKRLAAAADIYRKAVEEFGEELVEEEWQELKK
jgi:hypothetical protein